MTTEKLYSLTMDIDELRGIARECGTSNALYRAIVAAQAGDHLDDLVIDEWAGHWPVIDANLVLTGEVVDSDSDGWRNYDDRAAIMADDAESGGWTLNDGYATPPETDDA